MFLRNLAHRTGGRFHQVPPAADTAAAAEIVSGGFGAGEVRATKLPVALFKSAVICDNFHSSTFELSVMRMFLVGSLDSYGLLAS